VQIIAIMYTCADSTTHTPFYSSGKMSLRQRPGIHSTQ